MSSSKVTQSQLRVLELLSAFDYLTTREVCEYLAPQVTKRSVEQRLHLLQQYNYIESGLVRPERGRASERRWSLLKKGCDTLGVMYDPPGKREVRSATPREAMVLKQLVEMKQLTTSQIRAYLHREKPKWYTWRLLSLLQRRGYIKGERLYPERGAASECYWTLCRAGAAAIGAKHHRGYLRRPPRSTIEHRGLLLEMSRQVEAAGWSLMKPRPSGRHRSETGDSPQRQRLVDAILHKEEMAIRNLLSQGYSANKVQERIERVQGKQIGALVPRTVNDYVAYLPHDIEQTVLLIPHPPWAGRTFWTRRAGQRRSGVGGRQQDKPRARLDEYSRLSRYIRVMGVFASAEMGAHYAEVLEEAGLYWSLVDEIGDKLAKITGSSP